MERTPDYSQYSRKERGLTLDEIIRSDLDMLNMTQISRVMGIHPTRLNYYAKTGQLMFPVQRSGNRYKVARLVFLKAMGVEMKIPADGANTSGDQRRCLYEPDPLYHTNGQKEKDK